MLAIITAVPLAGNLPVLIQVLLARSSFTA